MAEQETTPEATEVVYVPRPSWGPLFFALGAALVVVGIYGQGFIVRGWVYMIAGAVFALAAMNRMIRSSIRDFYVRPRKQRASTAVLPAGTLRAPKKN
jgi:hypothetical protein